MTHPLDNCLKEIEWLRAEWTKESKAHIDRIEAMEMAVNDARVLLLKSTSAMNRASDRIEVLEAALRSVLEVASAGEADVAWLTTLQLLACAALAPEQNK